MDQGWFVFVAGMPGVRNIAAERWKSRRGRPVGDRRVGVLPSVLFRVQRIREVRGPELSLLRAKVSRSLLRCRSGAISSKPRQSRWFIESSRIESESP